MSTPAGERAGGRAVRVPASDSAMVLGPYSDITEAIGHTPMVELRRLSPKPEVRIFAKLEGANPTGSLKDRIARSMLDGARASGALRPGQTILEASSGHTGISLAMIGARLRHPVRIVMPDNTTPERSELLAVFGAEIVYSPGSEGSNGAIRLAAELAAADPTLYMPYQYGNEANPRAHEETTGPEILAAVPDVDCFVAGLGTGGTLTGVGRYLKRHRPSVRVMAAEPLPGEQVQGLRSLEEGFVPPVLDASVLDERILVSNHDAVVGLRRLTREEGIFGGLSGGAAVAVAIRVAGEMAGGSLVVLLADGGWKYLSTDLWTRDLDQLEDELERSVLW
jgi:cysteine synthase